MINLSFWEPVITIFDRLWALFAPMYPERSCESLSVYCTCVPWPALRFLWSQARWRGWRRRKEHGAPFMVCCYCCCYCRYCFMHFQSQRGGPPLVTPLKVGGVIFFLERKKGIAWKHTKNGKPGCISFRFMIFYSHSGIPPLETPLEEGGVIFFFI